MLNLHPRNELNPVSKLQIVYKFCRLWLMQGTEEIPSPAHLAVHKKKIEDVSNWLKQFPHHRKVSLNLSSLNQKLLVTSGPAGTAKSTAIQSLASHLGWRIVEWINPIDQTKLTSHQDGINQFHYSKYRGRILVAEVQCLSSTVATLCVARIRRTSTHSDSGHSQYYRFLRISFSSTSCISKHYQGIPVIIARSISCRSYCNRIGGWIGR